MKPIIIYESKHHGNTEKIATAIAEVLEAPLCKPHEVSTPEEYNLIGFGSGIYFAHYHGDIVNFIDNLPILKSKKAFIFSTSGLREIPFFHAFNKKLKGKLVRKGFTVVGEFSCRGFDTNGILRIIGGINRGRPSQRDLEKARQFALNLRKTFLDNDSRF